MGLKLEVGKSYRDENGEKRGPLYSVGVENEHHWTEPKTPHYWNNAGEEEDGRADLIALWQETPTGPVRTVTRKVIVPGVYGPLRVESRVGGCQLSLPRENFFCAENAAELRAAIATLTEIADALEDQ